MLYINPHCSKWLRTFLNIIIIVLLQESRVTVTHKWQKDKLEISISRNNTLLTEIDMNHVNITQCKSNT